MLLTSTSDILRIVTGSAVDIDVQAGWADITTTTFSPGRTNTKITSATTTTIVASPAASTQRQVKTVIIRNIHASSSNLVTIQHYDGTNSITIFKRTLLAGETIIYDGAKFIVYNATGIPVQATEVGSIADGDYGDITLTGSGTTWTIDNGAVTLAKIVDATGQYKIMARSSVGAGDWEELTASADVFSILGAANYAAIRTLLGLVIGTNVQAYDAELAALAGLTSAANKVPYFTGSGTAGVLDLDTDTTLAANSDTRLATQKAVKAYVDLAVTGLLDFKGATDASSNPNYPAASKGDAYVVSVAGKVGGASGKSVDVGDMYLATADNAGGTEASVGTSWVVLEHNLTGALLSANNLSDVANAGTARTNLGLAIGTNVQAYDADLTTWAGLTPSANAQSLVTAADYAAMLTLLFGVALPENTAIQLDAALSADGKYSGIVEAGTAGAALAFGDLVYLQTSDSRWELVDANAEATCKNKLGICVLAAAGDGSATTILLYGKVRADAALPALTIGAPAFASTTAGDVQTTAPSGTADIIRVVGYGNTADELFFCPSSDYYERA